MKYSGPQLSRGKRLDNGEWVEGFYTECLDTKAGFVTRHYIVVLLSSIEIDPDTLCAWIGLTDIDGVKVFAGDIYDNDGEKRVVEWDDYEGCFHGLRVACGTPTFDISCVNMLKVIGNVFEEGNNN